MYITLHYNTPNTFKGLCLSINLFSKLSQDLNTKSLQLFFSSKKNKSIVFKITLILHILCLLYKDITFYYIVYNITLVSWGPR